MLKDSKNFKKALIVLASKFGAVYKLENFDYNIHEYRDDISKIIVEMEQKGYGKQKRNSLVSDIASTGTTILRRYSRKSGAFSLLTKGTSETSEDNGNETDRQRTDDRGGKTKGRNGNYRLKGCPRKNTKLENSILSKKIGTTEN